LVDPQWVVVEVGLGGGDLVMPEHEADVLDGNTAGIQRDGQGAA